MAPLETKQWVTIGVSVAATVGAGCAVYYVYKKRSASTTTPKVEYEATVEKGHIAWLEDMATTYTKGDRSKAVCVLLQFCCSLDEREQAAAIFGPIRCNACGQKDKASLVVSVEATHVAYLDAVCAKHAIKGGRDKALRVILEYAKSDGDLNTIFNTIRCTHSQNCQS